MMTSSPTASSSSSTSMTEFISSTATTTTTNGTMPATVNTNTDHPYANNTVGRTDPEELLAEDLHRRASTISDAVTTTSSAEICRRFSNGSTSSTAASSMVTLPSVEEKPSPDSVVVSAINPLVTTPPAPPQSEEEENKQTVSSSASSTQSPDFTNDIVDQLAISPVPISSSSPDEQGQEELSLIKKEDEQVQVSSFTPIKEEEEEKEVEKELEQHNENNNDAELPVWADPDRVRENPTRYQYVKEYMDKHDIPKTSVMELPNAYTFYFSETAAAKHQKTPTANYMSTVKPIFDCQTVWNFSSRWRYYKQHRNGRPSQMKNNQNLYCFIKDVAPMWEDSTNKNGGRFTLCPNKTDMDELFDLILASFIGGTLSEFGMVGVVLSKRNRGDRIELWLDGSASIDTIPPLQAKLCQYLSEPLCALVNASRYKKHFDK
ncbi:translation initiation factor eIF 4e-like domain-containing protein [Circinella umbellata]|nr:translation initiation factor eIF 4e-like domain-containing protein [Circinella umbellata]